MKDQLELIKIELEKYLKTDDFLSIKGNEDFTFACMDARPEYMKELVNNFAKENKYPTTFTYEESLTELFDMYVVIQASIDKVVEVIGESIKPYNYTDEEVVKLFPMKSYEWVIEKIEALNPKIVTTMEIEEVRELYPDVEVLTEMVEKKLDVSSHELAQMLREHIDDDLFNQKYEEALREAGFTDMSEVDNVEWDISYVKVTKPSSTIAEELLDENSGLSYSTTMYEDMVFEKVFEDESNFVVQIEIYSDPDDLKEENKTTKLEEIGNVIGSFLKSRELTEPLEKGETNAEEYIEEKKKEYIKENNYPDRMDLEILSWNVAVIYLRPYVEIADVFLSQFTNGRYETEDIYSYVFNNLADLIVKKFVDVEVTPDLSAEECEEKLAELDLEN